MDEIIIDGSGTPLGRLASYCAKQALLGRQITVVNCNETFISGRKSSVAEEYKIKRRRGGSSLRGPHYPWAPAAIVKRSVRGMLSYKEGRGRAAFVRVRCYDEIPVEYKEKKFINVFRKEQLRSVRLKLLCEKL